MARFLGAVLRIGLLLAAIVCGVVVLRYSVIYMTTTYRLEWTGQDGYVWLHPIDIIVGEEKNVVRVSFSNYWTKKNKCYELRIYCSSCGIVPNDNVIICQMSDRGVCCPESFRLHPIYDDNSTVVYMVTFPERFSPRKEGDSLRLQLSFRGRDNVVCRVYKARLIRHCFDIFTDIT